MNNYEQFLATKRIVDIPTGMECSPSDSHPRLFPFQAALTSWAVRRGRAAIFANCGLGKTLMQLEWAKLIGKPTLILAPLAVGRQTSVEAATIGMDVPYLKEPSTSAPLVSVTNYERLSKFDNTHYEAVVLDESSVLKSFDGKTRGRLIERFKDVPYKLCCTATPSPNDIAEIANHAEFLGVMRRVEMLSTFFVHDEQTWRLKGHAQEAFWKWLASWSMCLGKPDDVGFHQEGFDLPPLTYVRHQIATSIKEDGMLFGCEVVGLSGRLKARRNTIDLRVQEAAHLVNKSQQQWLVWCGLNSESTMLSEMIPDAVEVQGSDTVEHKEQSLAGFASGNIRVLVTKPSIAGYGMNFQNCHNMAFVGLSDSFEDYYQAVRRCWRFGQTKEVFAHIITADIEGPVIQNIQRKEKAFAELHQNMIQHMKLSETEELHGQKRDRMDYETDCKKTDEWTMHLGDNCEVIRELADETVDFSICSPPFAALYTYTNSERDMGNSKNEDEFFGHYRFLIGEWLRITKPGRLAAIHVSQIPAMLSRDGYIGLKDFRGRVVAEHISAGWIYHGEVVVDKNPQAQAIRTKAKGLTFAQLERDASWMRPALADYLLLFRKPGENQVPVEPQCTREEWITWAHPCWYGISETDTLSVAEAREEKDERHICPLQLGLIERAIRLWSNRGDLVFSPFGGIGSEGYEALLWQRRFVGIELRRSYWQTACNNLAKAQAKRSEGMLFTMPA